MAKKTGWSEEAGNREEVGTHRVTGLGTVFGRSLPRRPAGSLGSRQVIAGLSSYGLVIVRRPSTRSTAILSPGSI